MLSQRDFESYIYERIVDTYGKSESYGIIRALWEDLWIQNRSLSFSDLDEIITRLKRHEPVAYITEHSHFYGMKLNVRPNVLIPRPETEELVEWVLDDHPHDNTKQLLDIGTGTGCIALAIKKNRPGWNIHAIDIDPTAVEVARANARELDMIIHVERADIFEQVEFAIFDIMVSNPPYITPDEKTVMSLSTLKYEPATALFVNEVKRFYQRIAEIGTRYLRPGGAVYFELNEFKAMDIKDFFEDSPLWEVAMKKDISGKNRMLKLKLR